MILEAISSMILGSLIFTKMPKPKDRVRVIYLSMLFSLGTENFILAFSRSPVLWCYRSDPRMDIRSGNERKPECDHEKQDTRGTTGPCICLQKHASVFYDTNRTFPGRLPCRQHL